MSLILDFTKEEKETLKENWKKNKLIGQGTDGNCFLINNDVYKIYDEDSKIHNPITRDDLPLESFLFPTEIYTCDKKVFAYKTPYIKTNQLRISSLRSGNIPDIDKFKKALTLFIQDIYVLSENNIIAIDLAWRNTLFDGEKFCVIDTLDYEIDDHNTYEENINSLKSIIKCFILDCNLAHDTFNVSFANNSLEEFQNMLTYIDEISENIKEKFQNQETPTIKRA